MRRIVKATVVSALFLLASFAAMPAIAHADDPTGGESVSTTDIAIGDVNGGPRNMVQIVTRNDHDVRIRGRIQLGREPGPIVAPGNLAAAVNVCRLDCHTLAVALQLNLFNAHPSVLAPQNFAGAVNGGCDGCEAYAVAIQVNLGVEDPANMPPGVNAFIVQMRHELTTMSTQSTDFADAIDRLNVVLCQYNWLVGHVVEMIQHQTTPAHQVENTTAPAAESSTTAPAAAPASNPTPADTSAPAAAPASQPDPSPSPEPTPAPAPADNPVTEASPQPSPSP